MAPPDPGVNPFSSAWEVLLLFLIPVGSGIPGGVLLARSRGLGWPVMALLYFVSDVILACVFEPLMLMVISGARSSPRVARFRDALKQSFKTTTAGFGTRLGPIALVLIAFGVDPMTGRAATYAAGHGFVTGWALSILGDMFYFALIMVSTLWLNSILGDGTKTMLIIMGAMFIAPTVIRRISDRWRSGRNAPGRAAGNPARAGSVTRPGHPKRTGEPSGS